MNRLLVCALVASLGNASAAFAGESLLTSGTRHVQQIAASDSAAASSATMKSPATAPVAVLGQKAAPSFQEGQGGNLSKSSHSKGTKVMIYTALAVGFALSAWEIDKHVLNITPSSLGQRKD
jgi:hypothetical protein